MVYQWNERVLDAGKMQDDGELDQAEARYKALLETSPDAEARRYVWNELAAISEERGDWKKALERYEKVWKEKIEDEDGGHALFRSSLIVTEHLGDAERGRVMKRRVIERYPKSVSAEFATRDLAAHYRDKQAFTAMRAELDELYAKVDGTPVADNILFEVGETLEVEADNPDAALPYYRRLYETYPDSGLADDALWQAAMIYHRRQNWPDALRLFSRLADNVETSWFVGSYNSPWANDARMQLGLTHLLYLDDYETALEHFERYADDFPTSIERDDAAWHIVQTYRLMGDGERYRESLGAFIEDYPESRYVREAHDRLAEIGGAKTDEAAKP